MLLGGGGAGKTTIQNEFIKRGYKRGILYTTRNKRAKEIHGRDYMFVSSTEFEHLKQTGEFVATTKVGNGEYGVHKDFCNNDVIMVANMEMIEQLKRNTKFDIVTIYVKTTEEQRRERLQKRGSSKEEIEEKIQRNNIYQETEEQYADFVIENNELEQTINNFQNILKVINHEYQENNDIVDAHSHIGIDHIFGTSTLEDYIKFCRKNGITCGNVMPQPNPAYIMQGKIIPCMSWKYEKGTIKYDTYDHSNENPYKYINYYYYKQCKEVKDINVNFIPLVHPVLDTTEYLEKLIKDLQPLAIKIHGIGSGISPKDITQELITLLKKYDLPIITHVECDTRINTSHSEGKKYIKKINNAYDWANFLVRNNLRGILTHGLALDEQAIYLVKHNRDIMIGIGPDLLISKQPHRLKKEGNSQQYLQMLKESIPVSQIVFDVDFNWNIDPKTNEIDEKAIERIKKIWQLPNEQKRIFSQNVKEFYYNKRKNIEDDIQELKGEDRDE